MSDTTTKSNLHIRYVDDETKRRFKAYARENGLLLAGALKTLLALADASPSSPSRRQDGNQ